MSQGNRFVNKCLATKAILEPWPHQILHDTFDRDSFTKLTDASLTKLSFSENDNCPAIIRIIPIAPEENNILLFIVKKNI